jgi:hypothetical protein
VCLGKGERQILPFALTLDVGYAALCSVDAVNAPLHSHPSPPPPTPLVVCVHRVDCLVQAPGSVSPLREAVDQPIVTVLEAVLLTNADATLADVRCCLGPAHALHMHFKLESWVAPARSCPRLRRGACAQSETVGPCVVCARGGL